MNTSTVSVAVWAAQSFQWLAYRLADFLIGVRFSAGERDFSLLKSIRLVIGPGYLSNGNQQLFPQGKAGGEADHSLRASTKFRTRRNITTIPHTPLGVLLLSALR